MEEKIVVQEEPELVAEAAIATKMPVVDERQQQGGKWLEGIFKKTKEWFEAEPDVDLK